MSSPKNTSMIFFDLLFSLSPLISYYPQYRSLRATTSSNSTFSILIPLTLISAHALRLFSSYLSDLGSIAGSEGGGSLPATLLLQSLLMIFIQTAIWNEIKSKAPPVVPVLSKNDSDDKMSKSDASDKRLIFRRLTVIIACLAGLLFLPLTVSLLRQIFQEDLTPKMFDGAGVNVEDGKLPFEFPPIDVGNKNVNKNEQNSQTHTRSRHIHLPPHLIPHSLNELNEDLGFKINTLFDNTDDLDLIEIPLVPNNSVSRNLQKKENHKHSHLIRILLSILPSSQFLLKISSLLESFPPIPCIHGIITKQTSVGISLFMIVSWVFGDVAKVCFYKMEIDSIIAAQMLVIGDDNITDDKVNSLYVLIYSGYMSIILDSIVLLLIVAIFPVLDYKRLFIGNVRQLLGVVRLIIVSCKICSFRAEFDRMSEDWGEFFSGSKSSEDSEEVVDNGERDEGFELLENDNNPKTHMV